MSIFLEQPVLLSVPRQMITGCLPRSKILRHSFSMGEWNPPLPVWAVHIPLTAWKSG